MISRTSVSGLCFSKLRCWRDSEGASAAEYVLLVFLVVVFVLGVVLLYGDNIRGLFSASGNCLAGSPDCTPHTRMAEAPPDRWGRSQSDQGAGPTPGKAGKLDKVAQRAESRQALKDSQVNQARIPDKPRPLPEGPKPSHVQAAPSQIATSPVGNWAVAQPGVRPAQKPFATFGDGPLSGPQAIAFLNSIAFKIPSGEPPATFEAALEHIDSDMEVDDFLNSGGLKLLAPALAARVVDHLLKKDEFTLLDGRRGNVLYIPSLAQDLWSHLDDLKNLPEAEVSLERLAGVYPAEAIWHFDRYRDWPNADKVFLKSANDFPLNADLPATVNRFISELPVHLSGPLRDIADRREVLRHLRDESRSLAGQLLMTVDEQVRIDELLQDRGLFYMDQVAMHTMATAGEDNLDRIAAVSRTLYLRGQEPTVDNIQQAVQDLRWARAVAGSTRLFENRDVFLFINPEELDGRARFANADLEERIDANNPKSRTSYRPKARDRDSDIATALERWRDGSGPTTFVFDGHGSPLTLDLGNGHSITLDQLLDAYRQRVAAGRVDASRPDILLINGCYSGSFIRHFVDRVVAEGLPCPILFSESEFGQVAYSEGGAKGEATWRQMGPNAYVDDLRVTDREVRELENSTLIIPDPQGRPIYAW